MKTTTYFSILLLLIGAFAQAQSTPKEYQLPGKGLKQHDFVYVGEWDMRKPKAQSMFVVRDGKVVWQYSIPMRTATGGIQEFDDATMLPNGNIVYACMSGAGIVTPEKNLIWQYICAPGTETHSCQPIGKDSVLMVLNGTVGKVLIFNTATNTLLKEIVIPTASTSSHGQFRHVRWTQNKTIMVGLFAEKKVVEFDLDGKALWSVEAPSAWSAIRLHNGNTLISGDGLGYTREVNPKGETVWEFTRADAPFTIGNTQTANRLANGNTVICNWIAGNNKTEEWAGTVQVFEVTKDKKVVWALSSWENPDLGPATYIQLLDEPDNAENGELQR
ncbi:MAG TPA: hypothetical protein DCL77_20305 [Prolixibacteraceae bacterium]|jgi:hypothetical protein|nr:hypothetical protein [Prolixibacteraceae bacterium]